MAMTAPEPSTRRGFLAVAAAVALLAFPRGAGAVIVGGPRDPVRRLLALATRNAFARVTAPDGFWNSPVARIALPVLFGRPGQPMRGVLASRSFREQLQDRLNRFAEVGARRAEPVVTAKLRRLVVANPAAVLGGEPTSATTLLRAAVGPALVNAMIPTLRRALHQAQDPIIAQAVAALKGVDLGDVAHALANEADNAIWYEVGAEEAAIRRNPEASGDPVLAAALRAR